MNMILLQWASQSFCAQAKPCWVIADKQKHRKCPEKRVYSAKLALGLLELIGARASFLVKGVEIVLTCCLVRYGHSCSNSSSGMSALLPDMYLAAWPDQTGSRR